MTIYSVTVPVGALVRAESETEAIQRLIQHLTRVLDTDAQNGGNDSVRGAMTLEGSDLHASDAFPTEDQTDFDV